MRKLPVLAVLGVLLLFVIVRAEAAEMPQKAANHSNILFIFQHFFDKKFVKEFAGEWRQEILPGMFDGKPALRIRLTNKKKPGEFASLITIIPREDEIPDAAVAVINELRRLINMKMVIF